MNSVCSAAAAAAAAAAGRRRRRNGDRSRLDAPLLLELLGQLGDLHDGQLRELVDDLFLFTSAMSVSFWFFSRSRDP